MGRIPIVVFPLILVNWLIVNPPAVQCKPTDIKIKILDNRIILKVLFGVARGIQNTAMFMMI